MLDARSRKGKPRFVLLLRQAAQSLHLSHSSLGSRYRRLRSRHGAPKVLTTMAHCLARIIYRLVTRKEAFDESVFANHELDHAKRPQEKLHRQARAMGFTLVQNSI